MEDLFAFEKHCIVLFFRCYNQKVFYLIPVHTCTLDNGSRRVLSCNSNFYFCYAVPCQLTQNYFLPLYLLKHCSGALLTFHENFNADLYFHFFNSYRMKQFCLFRQMNRIFLYKTGYLKSSPLLLKETENSTLLFGSICFFSALSLDWI